MSRPARRARPAAGPGSTQTRRMRMRSLRSAVAPTVDRVLAAVLPAGLSQERLDSLAVAVAEALSNAAVHGHKLDARRQVRITVEVVPGRRATVEVKDAGAGFDSAAVHDPTDPARVLIPGGRGVFLMRRLVDELEYNAAGNAVRLTMRT